jgi:hypothetical protein
MSKEFQLKLITTADSPFIRHYTVDQLRRICALTKIDITGVTKKEEILSIIMEFKQVVNEHEISISSLPSTSRAPERRKLCNVQPFDATKTTITGWLDSFERACANQGFENMAEWPKMIDPFLTGAGQRAYENCEEDERKDWIKFKGEDLASVQRL